MPRPSAAQPRAAARLDRGAWVRRLLFAHLLLSPVVLSRSTVEAFEFPKVALLGVVAILCAVAGVEALASSPRPAAILAGRLQALRRDPLSLGIGLFVLSASVSTVWSISSGTSWHGAPESYAGLLTVVAYAVLFLATREACRDPGDFRMLLGGSALAAAPVTAYAVVQILGLDPLQWGRLSEFGGVQRAASTMGHANFLAAFLAMCLPLLFYFGGRALKEGRRVVAALAALTGALAVFVIASVLSRAGWLAVLVAAAALAAGWPREAGGVRRRRALLIGAAAAVLLLLAGLALLPAGRALRLAVRDRVSSLAGGELGGRAEIWRAAVQMFGTHPVSGVGLDVFQLAFQRHRSLAFWHLEGHHTPQKAHSEPLHVLATQGALGGLALVLIGAGAVRGARRARRAVGRDEALLAAAVASLAAFVAQDLFSFTVAGIGTLAVTLLALVARLGNEAASEPLGTQEARAATPVDTRFLVVCLAAVAGVAIWVLVVRPYRGSLAAARAAASLARNPPAARVAAQEAVRLDPDQPLYWLQLGASAELIAARAPASARPPLFGEARAAITRARDLVPADAYAHEMLGRVLTEMSAERPPLATPSEAAGAFAEALARDPSNPFLVAKAARSAADLGEMDRAESLALRGEELDPGYGAFPWTRGYRRLARGMDKRGSDPVAARAEFEEALPFLARALDLDWREEESGRGLAAHHLAVTLFVLERYTEAEAAARRALQFDPALVDARFNLARIFERRGDREAARAEYRRVLAASPSHAPARAALAALGDGGASPPAGRLPSPSALAPLGRGGEGIAEALDRGPGTRDNRRRSEQPEVRE